METHHEEKEVLNETQSLQVIREMIELSRKKLRNDGILFIVWGWALFYSSFRRFLVSKILFSNLQMKVAQQIEILIMFIVFGYTLYYIFRKGKQVRTYIGISLRYVWFSAVLCLVLINLIQWNVVHTINFELQHPIFMAIIAFAVVVTGVMLRYGLMIAMGILFGILAYLSSFFELHLQLLVEAIAWFLAFIIPGHILYAKKTKSA